MLFISTACIAAVTCAQSEDVMPAVPVRSEQDWLRALYASRNPEPDVRYVVSARYWIFAAFVSPMPVMVWLLYVPPSTISAYAWLGIPLLLCTPPPS